MTTSVSSVSTQTTQAAAAQSTQKKSDLSESTKRQLEALGIPVTDGMTEAQAQTKIQEAQRQEAAQNGEQETGQNLSETEVLADAKSLASRVGVSYDDDETVDEILSKVSDELDAMIEEAGENPQQINTILEYYRELKSLDDQYDNIQPAQNSLYAAINMVSTNNKIALGLE